MHYKSKKSIRFAIVMCLMLALTSCGHEHEWIEATCTEPRTCAKCKETEGEPLGHEWIEATCTEPRTCAKCKETEGEPLGHDWIEATCTEPKKCKVCGTTEGQVSGHNWTEATCTAPKTCKVCSATEGDPLGHKIEEWKTTVEPTCTEAGTKEGTCTVCGQVLSESVEAKGHTPGNEWVIIYEATATTPGTRAKVCVDCGEQLETESYNMQLPSVLTVDNCEDLADLLSGGEDYEKSAKFAETYYGKTIQFEGSVDYIAFHGSYNTRYDILLSAGDYSEDHQIGPTLKFEDVNASDVGEDFSVSLEYKYPAGTNITIKAEVGKFNSNTGIFILEPISITER